MILITYRWPNNKKSFFFLAGKLLATSFSLCFTYSKQYKYVYITVAG